MQLHHYFIVSYQIALSMETNKSDIICFSVFHWKRTLDVFFSTRFQLVKIFDCRLQLFSPPSNFVVTTKETFGIHFETIVALKQKKKQIKRTRRSKWNCVKRIEIQQKWVAFEKASPITCNKIQWAENVKLELKSVWKIKWKLIKKKMKKKILIEKCDFKMEKTFVE